MRSMRFFIFNGLLCIATVIFSTPKPLTMDIVKIKAVAIKKLIDRHNKIASFLVVAGCVQQVAFWLPTVADLCNVSLNKNVTFVKREQLSFYEAVSSGFYSLFYTTQGWRDIFKFLTGEVVTLAILQKIDEKYRHPDTLGWYIKVYVPYKHIVDHADKLIKVLLSDGISEQKKQRYHGMLCGLCEKLGSCSADICGYMVYKALELDDVSDRVFINKLQTYVLDYHNSFSQNIFDELSKQDCCYETVRGFLLEYKEEITRYKKTSDLYLHQ